MTIDISSAGRIVRVEPAPGSFGGFVAQARRSGGLVVQPRMGMSSPRTMREGLLATRRASATTVGTITLDSYTRVGSHSSARQALADGVDLNGYPIVAHDLDVTRGVLRGVQGVNFPVQVRHGSAAPQDIFAALVAAGLDATEGGPVSYCLPYSRTPIRESVNNWIQCCEVLAQRAESGAEPHLETFGGCMMGQLCPPSLLVAISALEAMFFAQHGLRSVSLSYAQQTNPAQDEEAVRALRRIAAESLPGINWHVVIYTYMGVYPRTPGGARGLLEAAARLAVRSGSERLIVKTEAEAHRIPTIAENVTALEAAGSGRRERARLLERAVPTTPASRRGPRARRRRARPRRRRRCGAHPRLRPRAPRRPITAYAGRPQPGPAASSLRRRLRWGLRRCRCRSAASSRPPEPRRDLANCCNARCPTWNASSSDAALDLREPWATRRQPVRPRDGTAERPR